MSIITQIKETTDYGSFKTIKGNRPIGMGHVDSLKKSIEKHDLLSANPIIVNKNMEIIDGQHRLEAAKIMGVPIYYVMFNPTSLTEIQLLNANVRQWRSIDFLESYIKLGKRDYKIFKDFWEKYQFTFGATIRLLDNSEHKRDKGYKRFKEGLFEIQDLKKSIETAEIIKRLMKYSATPRQGARFYETVVQLLKKDPSIVDKLEAKLILGQKIYRMDNVWQYKRQFEDILNYKNYGKPILIL